MTRPLARALLAEFLGSLLLAALVIGSGIAAQRLSPGDVGLQLLENAAATAVGLHAIILVFGPVSGGHFNPVVSLVDAVFGGLPRRHLFAYAPTQVLGCVAGAVVANTLFDAAPISISTTDRATWPHGLSEVVATLGLLLVVFSLARSGRAASAPAAVGAYIGAAYFFTSSTSFANPAITVGRVFSDSFAGIAPSSVPAYVLAQLVAAAIAVPLLRALYPHASAHAEDAVLPHPTGTTVRTGGTVPVKPSVLFVCVHNAGRSQMAAAWLSHLAGDRVEVRSAGSAPADEVNPAVVEAMREVGVDISARTPKVLTHDAVRESDVCVTMGCGDACPVFPGKRYLDWKLTDPAGQGVEAVRPIRDEIKALVEGLIAEIAPAPTS